MQIQTTATIRDRSQITIPEKIRKSLDWAKPKAVVSIKVTTNKELIIKPYEFEQKKEINWEEVWRAIREARLLSAKGKKISLSQFIITDREKHQI